MRDPNRIDPFLQELGKIWKESCPDWRFGQLILNVWESDKMEYHPFYCEDERMIEQFKKYFEIEDKEEKK